MFYGDWLGSAPDNEKYLRLNVIIPIEMKMIPEICKDWFKNAYGTNVSVCDISDFWNNIQSVSFYLNRSDITITELTSNSVEKVIYIICTLVPVWINFIVRMTFSRIFSMVNKLCRRVFFPNGISEEFFWKSTQIGVSTSPCYVNCFFSLHQLNWFFPFFLQCPSVQQYEKNYFKNIAQNGKKNHLLRCVVTYMYNY